MRAPPSITRWVLCVRSKRRAPPGLMHCSEAAAALKTAEVILLIHMLLLKKKIDWGSELSCTGGDHRLLSLFCGGERASVRAGWCRRRGRRGGGEEESDTCTVIDFNSHSPFPEIFPRAARMSGERLLLGLERALLSLSAESPTRPRNEIKCLKKNLQKQRTQHLLCREEQT